MTGRKKRIAFTISGCDESRPKAQSKAHVDILPFIKEISSAIASLKGGQFENLVREILKEAGFSDVIKQSAGSQGGFDIRAKLNGAEWRFEAKHDNKTLDEKVLADKFDQIEASPGGTEYYIIVTNAHLGNNLRTSIENHQNKWYIDLNYWSKCNEKLDRLVLSYPETLIRELRFSDPQASQLRIESKKYLLQNKPFLEEEMHHLLKSSNRFTLLQRAADSISKSQSDHVKPPTDISKLILRKSANTAFDQFKKTNTYFCFFLIAKEQMGKSSLMRLWADSVRKDNIVFFFDASKFCSADWMKKLQDSLYAEISGTLHPLCNVPNTSRLRSIEYS